MTTVQGPKPRVNGPPILMQRVQLRTTKSVAGGTQSVITTAQKKMTNYASDLEKKFEELENPSQQEDQAKNESRQSREEIMRRVNTNKPVSQKDVLEGLLSQKKQPQGSAAIDRIKLVADKNKRRLKKENEALAKICLITQENMITNDDRFEKEIVELKKELDGAIERKIVNEIPAMGKLRATTNIIQEEIAQLRGVAQRQADYELATLTEAFQRQLAAKQEELRELTEASKNTSGEWTIKNNDLQEELKTLMAKIETSTSLNNSLEERNKFLRIEFEAQADDTSILEREFNNAKTKNLELRTQIAELEAELAQAMADAHANSATPSSAIDAQLIETTSAATQEERIHKYEEAITRTRRLIELEKKNLQAVRQSHLNALSCRTELEVYLRHSIVQHQKTLKSAEGNDKLSVFTAEDRRRVIEKMLSHERVLSLLYSEETAHERLQALASNTENVSLDELWGKWKQWAQDANGATPQPNQSTPQPAF